MGLPGEEGLFLDLRPAGTAEGVKKRFPPPYFLAFLDGAKASDKAGLMDEIAPALKFPAYFGKNWDALLDCLRSLPNDLPAGGYALAILNSGAFLSASAQDLEDFADVAGEARSFLREKFKADFVIILL
ncbi:MAG: barstar family protein [Elusimicrobiales bacterium]|nr:barstar family protein [Elusimicrobiales bacterium]